MKIKNDQHAEDILSSDFDGMSENQISAIMQEAFDIAGKEQMSGRKSGYKYTLYHNLAFAARDKLGISGGRFST